MKNEVLRMEHIYVKQRDKFVLSDFKLNIYEDEFVVLYGYSSSGINELAEVLLGKRELHSGRVLVDGREIYEKQGFLSEKQGIFWVQYNQNLIPDLTVAENLFLGEKKNWLDVPVSRRMQEQLAREILEQFGMKINVRQKAKTLNYHEEEMVRLIKAYVKGAKLIIVNASMEMLYMGREVKIIDVIRKLREDGIGILWLTQRMDIVPELANRIVVMRDGKNVRNIFKENYSETELMQVASARMMKEVSQPYTLQAGAPVFVMENIRTSLLDNVSLKLCERQVLGVYSLDADALDDFRKVIMGQNQDYTGRMVLQGNRYAPTNYEQAVKSGINLTDIMWHDKHILPEMTVMDNLLMEQYWTQNPMFGLRNRTWEHFVENRLRMRHPEWPMKRWRELTNEQQWQLLLEKCLYQTEKVHVIVEPLIRYSYGMLQTSKSIFEELKQLDKAVIIMSSNLLDLEKVCDDIVFI